MYVAISQNHTHPLTALSDRGRCYLKKFGQHLDRLQRLPGVGALFPNISRVPGYCQLLHLCLVDHNIIIIKSSKHLKGRSVPRVSQVFLTTRDFVVFLFLDTFPFQKCLETGKRTKSREKKSLFSRDLVFFPVSKHFNF